MSFLDKPGSWTRVGQPIKAASGIGAIQMATQPQLQSFRNTPQEMMKKFLKAYKVGWFFKAGSAVSFDTSNLEVTLKDAAGNEIPLPPKDKDFASLSPVEQCRRLLDMPNPKESWRQFIEKSIIRYDFAGNAIWYLDEMDDDLCPTGIYNISPTRMWPAQKGTRVIGWVLDWNERGGGTPFTIDEIVHLSAGSADDEVFGVGVVESVLMERDVNELLPKHVSDVLTLGGRLAGMVSPKERSLGENEFQDTLRAWRQIANSGDAAKRLLVFPEPVEWTRGAATPQEIGLPGLNEINRANILSAFPVSEFRLGVTISSGLNSGDTRQHMFREHWEFSIHPRAQVIRETWQHNIVDRFAKKAGEELIMEIKEPGRENAPMLLEKAAAFRALLNLGFDPNAIIPAVGLDNIKWDPNLLMFMIEQAFLGATEAAGQAGGASPAPGLGTGSHVNKTKDPGTQARNNAGNAAAIVRLPNPLLAGDVGQRIFVNDSNRKDNITVSQSVTTQRKAATISGPGKTIVPEQQAQAQRTLDMFLKGQQDRVVSKVRQTWPSTKAARKAYDDDQWWDEAFEDAELREALRSYVNNVSIAGLEEVSNQLGRVLVPQQYGDALESSWAFAVEDIQGINATTKQAIEDLLRTGANRGYTVNQIINGVEDEGFTGLSELMMDNGQAAWSPQRAETVARTSLMKAYNRSNLLGYEAYGVSHVQARDGDYDAECAARDGRAFSIEDAMGIHDHPNGTLDWLPLLNQKALTIPSGMDEVMTALSENTVSIKALTEIVGKPKEREIVRDARGKIVRIREVS